MTARVVYVLALLPVVVVGISLTYSLASAQARWDAARYTRAELLEAQAAHEQLAADYARFRESVRACQ